MKHFSSLLTLATLLATGAQAQVFGPLTTYSTGSNTTPKALAIGDVTGDGQLDVVYE